MLGRRSFLPAEAVLVFLEAAVFSDFDCLLKHSGFTVMPHCFGESGRAGDLPDSEARMVTWEDVCHFIHLLCFKKNGNFHFHWFRGKVSNLCSWKKALESFWFFKSSVNLSPMLNFLFEGEEIQSAFSTAMDALPLLRREK